MSALEAPPQHVRIRPPDRWGGLGARELWEYRELFYFLTKRDVQVRYKQTFLGAGWAILQPLALTAIFAVVMGRLVNVPSEGVPYALLALSGVTVWMFVSGATSQAGGSLVADANLLSKVYFPRIILPLAKVGALLVDLAIAQLLLVVVAAITGHIPGVQVLLMPAFVALAVAATAGIGVLTATANVRYRDVTAVMPLFILLWLFITPVAYPASLVGGAWELLYAINPIATAITGVRWAVLGTPGPAWAAVGVSLGVTIVVGVAGVLAFRRSEAHFADVI